MRAWVVSAALVLVGCGFSASTPAGNGGDAGADARTVDGPPDDVDGDGVKNEMDNCPSVANSDQFDEDMDAKGDVCDPCPHLARTQDDADDDGDMIGNGCDPRPSIAGDTLAYWNGFHTAAEGLPSAITLVHGDAARWSIAGGALVYSRAGEDWQTLAVDAGAPSHTVDAQFQIVQSYGVSFAAAAGVAVDIATNDTDLFDCQSRTDDDGREIWRRDPQGTNGWTRLAVSNVTTPNDTYRVVLQRTAGDLSCVNTRLGAPSVSLSDSTDSSGYEFAGLFARNVDVGFRYIAIYRSP